MYKFVSEKVRALRRSIEGQIEDNFIVHKKLLTVIFISLTNLEL